MKILGPKPTRLTNAIFSPDGLLLASHGADRVVDLWDLSDLSSSGVITCSKSVSSSACSWSGELLAFGHHDGSVSVWDLKSQTLLTEFRGWHCEVANLTFLKCDKSLILHSAMGFGVFNIETGALTSQANSGMSHYGSFAYDYSHNYLIWTDLTSDLSVWDPETGKQVERYDKTVMGGIEHMACSMTGKYLACVNHSGRVLVLNMQTHELLQDLKIEGEISMISFSPCDEELLAVAVGGAGYRVFDIVTATTKVDTWSFSYWRMSSINISPRGSQVAIAMWRGGYENAYREATPDEMADHGIISVPAGRIGTSEEGAVLLCDM